jgi:hypothetical protein
MASANSRCALSRFSLPHIHVPSANGKGRSLFDRSYNVQIDTTGFGSRGAGVFGLGCPSSRWLRYWFSSRALWRLRPERRPGRGGTCARGGTLLARSRMALLWGMLARSLRPRALWLMYTARSSRGGLVHTRSILKLHLHPGAGFLPVGRRRGRRSERQPAVALPGLYHMPSKVAGPRIRASRQ